MKHLARKAELEIAALNVNQAVKLKPTRLSDLQLAEAESAIQKLEGSGHGLVMAVDYFLRTWKPSTVSKTVKDAYEEFLLDKKAQKLRQRSIEDLKNRVNKLVKVYPNRLVSELAVDDIKRLISRPGRAARTRNGDRRSLHTFFEWCLKHDFCTQNPVAKIDPSKVDDQRPEILTLQEVKKVLRTAMDYKEGVLVPYFTLSLFAGLRPAELSRISWRDIDLTARLLTVDGNVAKLRKRRNVELSENLIPWLLPHLTKPIVGENWRRDFDAVRKLAGFDARKTEATDLEKLTPWAGDVLRHTALSHHLALHKHEGQTACWAGNSPDTVQRFYKGLVKPADAAEFWKLVPEALKTTVTSMKAAA